MRAAVRAAAVAVRTARAADALGHVAHASELEVDAAEDRAGLAVDLERLDALGDDVLERARLEPLRSRRRGGDGVAVHAVRLPDHRHAALLDSGDVSRQELTHLRLGASPTGENENEEERGGRGAGAGAARTRARSAAARALAWP